MKLDEFKSAIHDHNEYELQLVRLFFKDLLGINLKRDDVWHKTIGDKQYSGFYVSRMPISIFLAYAGRKDMINIFVDEVEISKDHKYFTNERAWNFIHVNFLITQYLKDKNFIDKLGF